MHNKLCYGSYRGLLSSAPSGAFHSSSIAWANAPDDRYQIFAYRPDNRNEHWLLIRSEPMYYKEHATLLKQHNKHFEELEKALWHCSCQKFYCEEDAKKSVEKIIRAKKHFYQVSYTIDPQACFTNKGRPQKSQVPDSFIYQVEITGIASDLEALRKSKETLGRFILVTNVLDEKIMPDEVMLTDYKANSN